MSESLNKELNSYTSTRIRLQSFDPNLLSIACENLTDSIKNINGRIVGPIRLPTSKHYYCVLNSPHVDKKSREHFEVSEYKRLIDVYTPQNISNAIDSFLTIPVPPGVVVEIV